MNSLSTANLAIYVVLSIPVIYIFIRHWPTGALGWFYLFAFCTLRIVGGAMSMNSDGGSSTIISSVGLSPLLLAAAGILHEASVALVTHAECFHSNIPFKHLLTGWVTDVSTVGAIAFTRKSNGLWFWYSMFW